MCYTDNGDFYTIAMSEMHFDIKKLGVTEKQEKVYLVLLTMGKGTVTEIARAAEIKRPTLYLILEELLIQGIVDEFVQGKKRYFLPAHPTKLLAIAKKQLQNLEKQMPKMLEIYNELHDKPIIRVYEGIDAVKRVYKEMYSLLHKKKEVLWLSRIEKVQEYAPDILELYKKTIVSLEDPRVRELNYGNEQGKSWNKELSPMFTKHFQARVLPLSIDLGHTEHLILEDKIVLFTYSTKIFVTIIQSHEVTKTYRAMFDVLWQLGVVPTP